MQSPRPSSSESEAVNASPPKKSPRLIELDILRGFLLLWMTFTHLPTKVSIISNQTFGYVSGAEGFIFLAAFMVGQLQFRREQMRGEVATVRDLAKRTARVYVYHCGLLLIAFAVFAPIAVNLHRPAVENLLSFYLKNPKPAAIAAVLLQYRPSLLDILPLYVIFMALTPFARRVAREWGWEPVIYAGFSVWVAAQFGLRNFIFRHFVPFGIHVPFDSTGAFDIYAWQLLWVVGLALGTLNADHLAGVAAKTESAEELPRWLIRLSFAVAGTFLLLRYSPVDRWIDPNLLGWLIDKWHLGPARVINFSAIAILLVQYGSHIARLKVFKPLASLGQASLEVFCVHVLCCLAGDSLSFTPDPELSWPEQAVLLSVTLAALFASAHASKVWKESRRGRLVVQPA
ncbi:MAG: OpgC domain-containing protein [Bryobacteraceae bacterium]